MSDLYGEALRNTIAALERTTAMCRAAITWSPDDIQGLRYHAQEATREGMAALAAAGRPMPADWQPIETAPTNTSVLIFLPNWEHYGPAIYRAILVDMGTGRHWHTTGWAIGRDLEYPDVQPTHWQPLPDPPRVAAPSGEELSNG